MDTPSSLETFKRIIESTDLTSVLQRLVKVDGWCELDAEQAIKQYRNYLFLCRKYPDKSLPPSVDIDNVWHNHILHTKDYRAFCKSVFADRDDSYFDHQPFAVGSELAQQSAARFAETQELYFLEFGEYMTKVRATSLSEKLLFALRRFLLMRFPKLSLTTTTTQ